MNPLVIFGIRLLETMFVVGVLGSLAVLAVTMVEDIEVILDTEEKQRASVE